jgi:hypothetical protein
MNEFVPNQTVMLTKEQEALWSNVIGGLFLNFGGIEFIAFRWIQHFANEQSLADSAFEMLLNKKLKTIRELVKKSDLTPDVQKRAIELWNEVGKLSKTRNAVAHNPWVFGKGENGQLVGGILDIRCSKGSGQRNVPLISVKTIVETARRIAQIQNDLNLLLTQSDIDKNGMEAGKIDS